MAHLSHVIVRGLTGRRAPLHVKFDTELNVMWGSNGSGKTTLLKILHSAMSGETAPLLRLSFSSAEVGFITNRGERIVRSIERRVSDRPPLLEFPDLPDFEGYRDLDLARHELFEDAKALRWKSSGDDNENGYLRHRYLPISRIFDFRNRMGRPTRGGLSEVLDEVEYDRVFAEQIQSLWSEFHAMALQQTRLAQQEAVNRILGAVLAEDEYPDYDQKRELVPTEDLRRLVHGFFETQPRLRRHIDVEKVIRDYETNPLMHRVVSTVSEVQTEIEIAQAPERRFAEVINQLYGPNKTLDISGPRRLTVTLKGRKSPLAIESLASGEKQVMRILLETLVAGSSPVLVDEPELSLHVDWQSQLLLMMRYINPEAQIIVATHSPEVVGGASGTGLIIET